MAQQRLAHCGPTIGVCISASLSAALSVFCLTAGGCGGGGNGTGQSTGSAIWSLTASCVPTSILINQTSSCTATVDGSGNYSTDVSWSVAPSSIGSVSAKGVFTPAGPGTATIIAISSEDTSKSATAAVTVTAAPQIKSVTAACNPSSILTTQTSSCTATVDGSGSYTTSVSWSVSPSSIGNISTSGVFAPAGPGTATITAISSEDPTKSGGASVAITQASTPPTPTSVYYIVKGNRTWVRGAISPGKDIAQEYFAFRTGLNGNFSYGNAHILAPSTPNSISDYEGATALTNNGDDAAPINTANAGYLAEDHGLMTPVITTTCDKDASDVGSVWQDSSGGQYILAHVAGTGVQELTFYSLPRGDPWTYATALAGSKLTWVSGGNHSSVIAIGSQSAVQEYPVVFNVVNRVLVNGTIAAIDGDAGYADSVDFVEEYDLIDPSTINTTNNPWIWNSARETWAHIRNVYHATAGLTVVHSTYSIERPMNLGYFGVVQVGAITANTFDHQYYYIPNSLPVGGYDFTGPALMDDPPATPVHFGAAGMADLLNPPDRQVIYFKHNSQNNYDLGFAFGLSPYGSSAPAQRSCAYGEIGCWEIYTSKKIYPVVMAGPKQVNNLIYDTFAYRQWIDTSSYEPGKSVYSNNLDGHQLVYIDYHGQVTGDTTTLPPQFAGWSITPIESLNVSPPPTRVAADGTVSLSTTGGTYAFAVFEVTPP